MKKKLEDIVDMEDFIKEELSVCELDNDFNCRECCDLEDCHTRASIKSSHEFAKSLDYCGYDSEEEFWENLD